MILDTCATKYISGLLKRFIKLTKVKKYYATLDDGTTKLQVMGKGIIRIYMDTHVVELHNKLFVPDLEDTLFSITEYIQSNNFSLNAENNSYISHYPTFNIKAEMDNEVHVNITPYSDLKILPDFTTGQTTMVNQYHTHNEPLIKTCLLYKHQL